MDINDIIEWLDSRQDIVIADKEKFVADLRDRFQQPDTEGSFLDAVRKYNERIRDEYTAEGSGNHLLVVATNREHVSTVWGGSIDGIAGAYVSIAMNYEDYITLMETVLRALMVNQIKKLANLFGHDTD